MNSRFVLPIAILLAALMPWTALAGGKTPGFNPQRNAYFGDLHVHTGWSWDAAIFAVRTGPEDAYRFAEGQPIDFVGGGKIRLKHGKMDFYAVTDHAEYLGILHRAQDPKDAMARIPLTQQLVGPDKSKWIQAFRKVADGYLRNAPLPELSHPQVVRSAWKEMIAIADRHYKPGEFTTFVGYEWTSTPAAQNLHRNVIFRGSRTPGAPFTAFDSDRPEDLWNWLDGLRAKGMEAMAIPHNPNMSNGLMFPLVTSAGKPVDAAWAEQRMRNEPIVEMTQVKGTSETHPALSPTDEWADFEIFAQTFVGMASEEMRKEMGTPLASEPRGSYVRDAYKRGLELQDQKGFNPYKFGMIGSTDTHNSASCMEEDNYFSKLGIATDTPQKRLAKPPPGGGVDFGKWSASGLAAVWAEENTREAIYDALRRKECFATTGTRIRVRFFAGYDFPKDLNKHRDMLKEAYKTGVPMGGDLIAHPKGKAPRFLVWATRDPTSAPLQRIQIIKGWMENGEAKEKVFDVVGSDGLKPDPVTYRIPDNGATVDLKTGKWSEDKGAAELSAVWTDPEFDPGQRAFYYVRVLEDPTLRWSTYDANKLGIPPRADLPKTIQERAYTSPIWYSPRKERG